MKKRFLRKLYNFLFRLTIVFRRDKPHVQVIYLTRTKITEPREAEQITIKGYILEEEDSRKIQKIGGSWFISFVESWLKSVANGEKVKEYLILTDDNEKVLLVRSPDK